MRFHASASPVVGDHGNTGQPASVLRASPAVRSEFHQHVLMHARSPPRPRLHPAGLLPKWRCSAARCPSARQACAADAGSSDCGRREKACAGLTLSVTTDYFIVLEVFWYYVVVANAGPCGPHWLAGSRKENLLLYSGGELLHCFTGITTGPGQRLDAARPASTHGRADLLLYCLFSCSPGIGPQPAAPRRRASPVLRARPNLQRVRAHSVRPQPPPDANGGEEGEKGRGPTGPSQLGAPPLERPLTAPRCTAARSAGSVTLLSGLRSPQQALGPGAHRGAAAANTLLSAAPPGSTAERRLP
ncbi:hypothetical protein NDU88_006926 [Pleurodeles waltl]|uniref:Uncharacterized protein n=1 Tax=Pleurodeles waltl TaxID=8319 RepID=A0AAV7NTD8_PLEWA|nr:hypothetical protein NDU88_006926 [Pleurodeles waltl]